MELTISFLVAQGFGFFALISYIISTQVNSRHKILFWRTVYSSVYAVQYLFLGAWSGCFSSLVPIGRNLVYDRYKKTVPTYWVVIFSVLTLFFGFVFYDGPISLLPIAHTVCCTIFLARNDLTTFRFMQAFSATLMFVYNFSVGAYIGLILVTIQFISMVIGIVRFDSEKIKAIFAKKQKTKKKSRP